MDTRLRFFPPAANQLKGPVLDCSSLAAIGREEHKPGSPRQLQPRWKRVTADLARRESLAQSSSFPKECTRIPYPRRIQINDGLRFALFLSSNQQKKKCSQALITWIVQDVRVLSAVLPSASSIGTSLVLLCTIAQCVVTHTLRALVVLQNPDSTHALRQVNS
jgi:hypothetical protein